jgi:hypothetical protein
LKPFLLFFRDVHIFDIELSTRITVDVWNEITGTVVCPTESYLSASPDGFIKRDTILEIKCPQKPPSDLAASGKYDIV